MPILIYTQINTTTQKHGKTHTNMHIYIQFDWLAWSVNHLLHVQEVTVYIPRCCFKRSKV